MADLVNFKQGLMVYAEQHNSLPNIVLSQATDLGQAANGVIGVDNRSEGESAAALVGRYVDEFAAAFTDESNSEMVSIFNEVVEVCSDKLIHVFTKIAGVKEHATSLSGEMEKTVQQMLARDPFVSAHAGVSTINVDFPIHEWCAVGAVGSNAYIIGKVNGSVTVESAEVPETFSMHHFKLACDNLKDAEPIKDIEFSEESKTAFVNAIHEATSDVSINVIKEGVDCLTISKQLNVVVNALASKDIDPSKIYTTIQFFSNMINCLVIVTDVIQSGTVEVSNSSKDALDENIEKARMMCVLMAYYIAMHRETSYKDAILLPDGSLNKDNLDAFYQGGGNNQMVAHYIRAMFKDDLNSIPVRGVPADSIVKSATALEERVKKDIANVEGRIAVATTQARVAAFKHISSVYLKEELKQRFGDKDDVTLGAIYRKVEAHVFPAICNAITMYNITFLDATLSMIMESSYVGTFAYAVFKKLGAAYINRANIGGTIDQAAIDIVEIGVITDIVSEFVISKLCCYEECKDMTVTAPVVPETTQDQSSTAGAEPAQEDK